MTWTRYFSFGGDTNTTSYDRSDIAECRKNFLVTLKQINNLIESGNYREAHLFIMDSMDVLRECLGDKVESEEQNGK